MSRVTSAALSDPGLQRESNEDALLYLPERGIFGVIDGVGGHRAGDVAARLAQERLALALRRPGTSPALRLREAFAVANNAIFETARQDPTKEGMSCVATVALIEDGRLTLGHVGDTRALKLRAGAIGLITCDHSPIGEREAAGELSEAEAMHHALRNQIFRDLGSEHHEPEDEGFVDVYEHTLEADAALVLCSDGLTDLVPKARILALVERAARSAGGAEAAAQALIEEANQCGGKDNVTVVVVLGEAFGRSTAAVSDPSITRPTQVRRDTEAMGSEPPAQPMVAPEAPSRPAPGTRGSYAQAQEGGWRGWWRRRRAASEAPSPAKASWSRRLLLSALGLVVVVAAVSLLGGLVGLVKEGWGPLEDNSPAPVELLWVATASPESADHPEAFPSISTALAAARAGQTIIVLDGVYREQLVLREGVSVISRHRGGVRLHAPLGAERVAVVAEGVRGARLAGLHIVGDSANPLEVGVRLSGSEVELTDLTILGASVAAIQTEGEDRSRIRACLLRGGKGGIVVEGLAQPAIENNLFLELAGPAVRIAAGARPQLFDNRFERLGGFAIETHDDGEREVYELWNHFSGKPERRVRVAAESEGRDE